LIKADRLFLMTMCALYNRAHGKYELQHYENPFSKELQRLFQTRMARELRMRESTE
jgi:hypothetical protein